MFQFIERLKKEWAVISKAPYSFAIVCFLAVGVLWGGFRYLYNDRLAEAERRAGDWKNDVDYWKDKASQAAVTTPTPDTEVERSPSVAKRQVRRNISQQSSGENSPNVVGNNNEFNYNADPPRRLTAKQISAIGSDMPICGSGKAIQVTAANGNQEAQRYASDFVAALHNAGCKAGLALPTPGLRPDVVGVHIGVRDMSNIDPIALQVSTDLSDAGIKNTIAPMQPEFFPGEQFVIVIGAKN